MEEKLKRKEGESELGYKARIYREKLELGLNNKEINEIINRELNINLAESSNRCTASAFNQGWQEAIDKYANEASNDEYLKELEEKKLEVFPCRHRRVNGEQVVHYVYSFFER